MALVVSTPPGTTPDLTALQAQVALLQAQLSGLQANVSGSVTSLQQQINTLGTEVSAATTTEASENVDMAALETGTDYALATVYPIAWTPSEDGYVSVYVNGQGARVGDGTRSADCYFSNDDGLTARAYADISQGDLCFWVGSVAGYELAPTDVMSFRYERRV